MSREGLRTMLLFAKGLQEADIIPNDFEEDQGFLTAIVRSPNHAEWQTKHSGTSQYDSFRPWEFSIRPTEYT